MTQLTRQGPVLTSEKSMVEGVVEALIRDGDVVKTGREKYAMREK